MALTTVTYHAIVSKDDVSDTWETFKTTTYADTVKTLEKLGFRYDKFLQMYMHDTLDLYANIIQTETMVSAKVVTEDEQ